MVSVDTVYQRVLVIANKEQRGYITPQEFNLLANQAQMEIFESYFTAKAALIATTGNETYFGDVAVVHAAGNGTSRGAACSDSHGGLN